MRVGVFVGTRADLGPLEPVIKQLYVEPGVDIVLLTGLAFSPEALAHKVLAAIGLHIEVCGLAPAVDAVDKGDIALQAAKLAAGAAEHLSALHLDLLVVLGDRWELLAVVTQAFLQGIPIVHIHGGEVTEGAIDDRVRHAITKLSDLHCVSSADAARRVGQLGEPADRIVVTGAPGLDRIAGTEGMSREEMSVYLGSPVDGSVALFTYHPETVSTTLTPRVVSQRLLQATLDHFDTVIATAPGFDEGREEILEVLTTTAAIEPRLIFVDSIGVGFPRILCSVDAMVGNSSAAIIEAPTAGTPSLDIGERQKGRVRGPSVTHSGYEDEELRCALASLGPRVDGGRFPNPYHAQGLASVQIVTAIKKVCEFGPAKRFVDVVGGSGA